MGYKLQMTEIFNANMSIPGVSAVSRWNVWFASDDNER